MTEEQRLRMDVLRDVVRTAERRRDGELPMDVSGVADTFRDEATLFSALHLRWMARLAGRIERRLAKEPEDVPLTIARSWAATAREMPGVRAVLDHCADEPTSGAVAEAAAEAAAAEHLLLGRSAGLASDEAESAGLDLEERGRESWTNPSLRKRLKAVLAA